MAMRLIRRVLAATLPVLGLVVATAAPAAAATTGHRPGVVRPMSASRGVTASVGGYMWNQEGHVEGSGAFIQWASLAAQPYVDGSPLSYPIATNCTVQTGYIFWQGGNGTHSHWSAAQSCSSFKGSPEYIFGLNVNWGNGTLCVYQYFSVYSAETPGSCLGVHS